MAPMGLFIVPLMIIKMLQEPEPDEEVENEADESTHVQHLCPTCGYGVITSKDPPNTWETLERLNHTRCIPVSNTHTQV
ncbi:hypothetical protein V6Z11_D10G174900 [Gossypium hirsutum]